MSWIAHSASSITIYGDNPPITKLPFYFAMRQNIFSSVPDNVLALVTPIVAYWVTSLFFYCLDLSGWTWLDKYRIHESNEVTYRNCATQSQAFWTVLSQHVWSLLLGAYWLPHPPEVSPSRCAKEMIAIESALVRLVGWLIDPEAVNGFLAVRLGGADVTYWLYWWTIPAAQLFFALFVVDTWQYFVHRWMHSNKYLYKVHSVHHRLRVPYAFGASYCHPIEGFLFDCLSLAVAETVTNLSLRQSMLLYTISAVKTVDDHCGYQLPYDPFQTMSGNNADYHDIHHETIGSKFNFSQPFFVHWDVIMGTRMTREDIEERRRKLKMA